MYLHHVLTISMEEQYSIHSSTCARDKYLNFYAFVCTMCKFVTNIILEDMESQICVHTIHMNVPL
jgi:hypothetical protein